MAIAAEKSLFTVKRSVFLVPLVLVVGVLYIIPLFGIMEWSVTRPELGLSNYEQALSDPSVLSIIWRTLWICLVVTCASVVCAYLMAYHWLFSRSWWQRLIEFSVLIAFWTSVLVRALGWLIVLRSNGLINSTLMGLGITDFPIVRARSDLGVILAMTHFMVPYAIFPLVSVMRQVDERILMASRGLGASKLRTFWMVFMPQTMSGIVGAFILVFVFTLGFYITPAIVGGGRVVMVAEYIFLLMFQLVQWGVGSALSVLMLILVLFLMWVLLKFSGVKQFVK